MRLIIEFTSGIDVIVDTIEIINTPLKEQYNHILQQEDDLVHKPCVRTMTIEGGIDLLTEETCQEDILGAANIDFEKEPSAEEDKDDALPHKLCLETQDIAFKEHAPTHAKDKKTRLL